MGKILAFAAAPRGDRGVVHVWAKDDSDFEIGHESRSGDSWGGFERFPSAQEAVAGAYRLNREQYGNGCEVYISPAVLALLPVSPDRPRGEF